MSAKMSDKIVEFRQHSENVGVGWKIPVKSEPVGEYTSLNW